MFQKKTYPPATMTDDEKVAWLAHANPYDIFPTAFEHDTEQTLIALLAQRIYVLEKKCLNLP